MSGISVGRSSSHMNVVESTSMLQELNWSKILIPTIVKTSIDSNSGSIKHRAMKFAGSMGFSVMADRMA